MKNIKKIILSLVLVGAILVSSVPVQAASVNIAEYNSYPFTSQSGAELRSLQKDADTISLVGYCDGENETDELICYIWGWDDDNSDFFETFPFTADGHTKTIDFRVPKGIYKIRITALNSNITKRAYVVFSVFD